MAIFHMSFSNISAGKGRSAIAGASYRSGEKLFDQKEGRPFFLITTLYPFSLYSRTQLTNIPRLLKPSSNDI